MQATGNGTQWGTSYPPVEQIEADIRAGKSYVCEADGVLAGVFYFSEEPDPDYAKIYEGSWIGTENISCHAPGGSAGPCEGGWFFLHPLVRRAQSWRFAD